jgi:hypothetical protein
MPSNCEQFPRKVPSASVHLYMERRGVIVYSQGEMSLKVGILGGISGQFGAAEAISEVQKTP